MQRGGLWLETESGVRASVTDRNSSYLPIDVGPAAETVNSRPTHEVDKLYQMARGIDGGGRQATLFMG